MAVEKGACAKCSGFESIINEKNSEINSLKLQIENLKTLLEAYKRQTKLCQYCSVTSSLNRYKDDILDTCKESETVPCGEKSVNEKNSFDTLNTNKILNNATLDSNISNKDHSSTSADRNSHSNALENQNPDYIYNEHLKMYYCPSTGYYYDQKSGLFYHTQTSAYYSYNYASCEYELYEVPTTDEIGKEECDLVLHKVNDLNINDTDPILKTAIKNGLQCTDCSVKVEESQKDETNCGSAKDWQPDKGSKMTIADLVRSVVNQNSELSDYVYDEKSKMYFSKSTGYYYDPVKKLLYDPRSKIYYLYVEETMSYEFYCNADEASSTSLNIKQYPLKNNSRQKSKKHWKKKASVKDASLKDDDNLVSNESENIDENISSPEEGEIVSSSDSDSETEKSIENPPSLLPPCIRAIIRKSSKLKIGTLILITCSGAIIGRDKVNTLYIPDIGVSKEHAEIKFCNDTRKFSIEDLGSQNGTFINDVRLSKSKVKSEAFCLSHGDVLMLGSCEMLLHVHDGYDTCNECEPGQVLAEIISQEASTKPPEVFKTKEEKEKERRLELSRMKKKYGLKSMEYVTEKKSVTPGLGYEDKAEIRRKTVGSQNPYEKTETASMEECIKKSNKGFLMLKKLGWKEGDTLGLTGSSGISEPIPLRPWLSKAGLGSSEMEAARQPLRNDSRQQKWVKAQERYLKLSEI